MSSMFVRGCDFGGGGVSGGVAKRVGVSPATVQRIWSSRGLQPHRADTFKVSAAELGRLGDGWPGSLRPPEKAQAGCEAIERAAALAGRYIEPDHFGMSLAVTDGEWPAEVAAAARRRRPDLDPA